MSKHAVVIGGGPGGLVTAHALAGCNWRVTVLERSVYPSAKDAGPRPRRGAPQSHCLHMLMGAGSQAFDAVVPNWRSSLLRHGAVPFDALQDAALRLPAGWLPRTESGIKMYACSRTLLEHVLHCELIKRQGSQVLQGQLVNGLVMDRGRVCGVKLAGATRGQQTTMDADLVIDVSGTASRLPHWLAENIQSDASGLWPETVVASGWQYSSRWFSLAPEHSPDWHCLAAAPDGNAGRTAMMLRAENDFWNVVLLAPDGQPMPDTDAAFSAFTAPLAEGQINAALRKADPVSDIHRYGRTANRLRHVDHCSDWPDGLAALGDTVLTLDPYFGLGMTNAARGAVLLADHLRKADSNGFDSRAFQQDLARLNQAPWKLATGRGPDGSIARTNAAGMAQLYAAAPSRPDIARAILEVQHLLRPQETLTEGLAA